MIKNLVIPTYLFDGLGIAIRAKIEGLNVFMIRMDNKITKEKLIEEKEINSWLELGYGLIDVYNPVDGIKKLKELNRQETFILFDFNYGGDTLGEEIRNLGFVGLIPTKEDRLFEKDRLLAIDFVNKNYKNIKTPESFELKNIEDINNILKEYKDMIFVLKPNNSSIQTFIPPDDYNLFLEEIGAYSKNNKKILEKYGFVLQRKIIDGFEFTPEVIFSLSGKPLVATIDIETKKFGNYGTSKTVGCSADLVFGVDINSKIIEYAVKPMFERVINRAQKGKQIIFWDANLIYDNQTKNLYFLEFCPNRFGINSFYTELEIAGGITNFLNRFIEEKNPLYKDDIDYELDNIFGSSIRLFNVDYKNEELSIPEINEHTWILDGKKTDKIYTTKFSEDAIILTRSSYNPYESLYLVQSDAFQDKWSLFYKRSDLTMRGFKDSILDRFDFINESDFLSVQYNIDYP